MSEATALATDAASTGGSHFRTWIVPALMAPWRATKRQTIWISLLMFGTCWGAALAFEVFMPDVRGQALAGIGYAAGAAALWAFCLSSLVLLARDARLMSIPGVTRNTMASAIIYGGLTVGIPALIEAALGGNMAVTAVLVALGMGAGLAFVLSPRWISIWLGFVPAIYAPLQHTFHILSPLDHRFLRWAAPLALVLLFANAVQWRRVLSDGRPDTRGWRSSMILQLRQQAVSRDLALDTQVLWRRGGDTEHRYTNLRGISARTPAKAIEVALGPLFVPRTAAGHLRQLRIVVWMMLAFGGAMLLENLDRVHSLRKLLTIMGSSSAMWMGMFGIAMTALLVVSMLRRRWEQGAEPALLALLPGLGTSAPLHYSVLRAAFTKPAILCAALWALMTGCELPMHLGTIALVMTTLIVLVFLATTVMLVLRVFAGRPMRTLNQVLIAGVAFVLMSVSLPAVFVTSLVKLGHIALLSEWGLLAIWLVFAVWMSTLAWRAWRALQRRPHPFLANVR